MPREGAGRGGAVCLVLAGLIAGAGSARAQDAATCDEAHKVCCAEWMVAVTVDGKRDGAYTADTYQVAVARRDKVRALAAGLCRSFGPQDPACRAQVAAPVCRTADATDAVLRGLADAQLRAIRQRLDAEAAGRRSVADAVDQLRQAAAGLVARDDDNPFVGPARQLRAYLDRIGDAQRRIDEVRADLRRLAGPSAREVESAVTSLWDDGAGFGGHVDRDRRQAELADRLAVIVAGLPPPPAIPAPATLELDRDYQVAAVRPGRAGGHVLVGAHLLARGDTLEPGLHPLAGLRVGADGKGESRAATVKKTGHHLRISVDGGGSVTLRVVRRAAGEASRCRGGAKPGCAR